MNTRHAWALSHLALFALALAAVGLSNCGTPGPYSDPAGVQLPLFGSRLEDGQVCSDPVFRETAMQCCSQHDIDFEVGGTRQDFHLVNAEFLACMLLWDVPREIAYARWRAVDRFGWSSWAEREHRTRGP